MIFWRKVFEITGSPRVDWSKVKFEITLTPGEDCSDIGEALLDDAAECQVAALKLELTYGGVILRTDYPKVCFTGHNRVYWNRHEVGTSSEYYFPVCKKEGNYNHWYCMYLFEKYHVLTGEYIIMYMELCI